MSESKWRIDPTAQYRVTCLQFLQTSAARRISRRRLCRLPVTSRVASLLRQLTHVASSPRPSRDCAPRPRLELSIARHR